MGNEASRGKGGGSSNPPPSLKNPDIDNARNVKYNFRARKSKTSNKNNQNTSSSSDKPKALKPVKLLVISGHHDENFYELFAKQTLLDGRKIEVEQSGWSDFTLTSYSESHSVVCNLRVPRRPIPKTKQTQFRTFVPNYLLVRNVCRGIRDDSRNLLYGLMLGNLPSINSLHSIYCMLDRPLMNAELVRLNKKYGQDQFPIIHVCYYPVHDEMLITPQYPTVVKIGHGHAGFGKMKLENHKQFMDLKV